MTDHRLQYDQAALLHRKGEAVQAAHLCEAILADEPAHLEAGYLLAVIRFQQGLYGEAIAVLERVLVAHPAALGPLVLQGLLLQMAQRPTEALASFGKALRLQPDLVEALNNRGIVLCDMGRFAQALDDFDRTLALRPGFAEAHYNRGRALGGMDRPDAALASYDRALQINPALVEALVGRGLALSRLKRFDAALASHDQALAIRPDYVEGLINRGDALRALGRQEAALASYDKVLALVPGHAIARNNRGSVLHDLGRFGEALASYDKALAVRPDFPEALCNRGNLQWTEYQRLEPALRDLEQAARLDPDCEFLRGDLLHLRMHEADWRDFAEDTARLTAGVRAGRLVAKPFLFQAITDAAADLKRCATLYTASRYPAAPALRAAPRRGPAKIRLGYVSGEFRAQATAFLTAGLYEAHDKSRFELVAFDNGRDDGSPLRKRLEASFDKFIAIADLSDDAAAQKILAEDIDILVNLNGYFGKHRMGVFARRPAPLQVNYLGFPGTLGASYFDYILADRIVIPDGQQIHYTEKTVLLPGSYQVNDAARVIAQTAVSRADCGLPNDAFVFCSFNQGYKLTPDMFAAWMRILAQTDGSVLWLLDSGLRFQENLRRAAQAQGIAPGRLIFAPMIPPQDHLARLKLADLFLDSFPCNGHTTASDALRAGLPLVTCSGNSFASRVATSLLHAVGLPELVTQTLEDYVALAIRLAADPALLPALRETLSHRHAPAPLFDTARFAHDIEAAYETMWEIAQRGEAPRGFAVGTPTFA